MFYNYLPEFLEDAEVTHVNDLSIDNLCVFDILSFIFRDYLKEARVKRSCSPKSATFFFNSRKRIVPKPFSPSNGYLTREPVNRNLYFRFRFRIRFLRSCDGGRERGGGEFYSMGRLFLSGTTPHHSFLTIKALRRLPLILRN